eukprot:maker-scaffold552_size138156-snap-gene-0.30 protein:Tk00645 transcript:maker-scaffold552_size138156-snap-gene-0.30-mRNA-1 annotation:"related to serine protease"
MVSCLRLAGTCLLALAFAQLVRARFLDVGNLFKSSLTISDSTLSPPVCRQDSPPACTATPGISTGAFLYGAGAQSDESGASPSESFAMFNP